jgi:predicted DNA-binding protein with PD1-like motif
MTWARGRLGDVIVARLLPGTEVVAAIEHLVEAAGIEYGLVLGGIASLSQVRLRNLRRYPERWPLSDEHRTFSSREQPLELVSLSGNLSRLADGRPWLHLHAVVALGSPDGLALGGHLVPGAVVLSTGEVALAEVKGMTLPRLHDEETLAAELCPRSGAGRAGGRR